MVAKRQIKLNPGAQYDFVNNDFRHSGYFGGRGAGKTFALVVRALRFAHQPKIPGQQPPVGCLLTDSFPHLKDIVYPAFYLVAEMSGLKYKEIKNQSDRKFVLGNGAEILMRSLDQPDRVRGLNLAFFGIDEGRNFDNDEAYKILLACLRQGAHPDKEIDEQGIWVPGENYKHAGWVTSTPNGYDWMWRRFHPDSPHRKPETAWFNAPTTENKLHLPNSFLQDLESDFEGLYYEQEVLGRFVGAVQGSVFPSFDPSRHIAPLSYRGDLPLYSFWDFGIGDAGVCIFAQVAWVPKLLSDGVTIEHVPQMRVLDAIEMTDAKVSEWADAYFKWLDEFAGGRTPDASFGDPAGGQRNAVTGTSVLQALGTHGVYVRPVRKHPVDESIIIIQNLLEGENRFLISTACNDRLPKAVQTHRWKVDDEGRRLSNKPIHDWTSHFCDALRYGALGVVGLYPKRSLKPTEETQRGTMGYVLDQLFTNPSEPTEMGQDQPHIDWHRDRQVEVDGWL